MRIAILSDLHLGFGWGTERQDDSFEQAEEALKIASRADMILIAGDIFDTKVPKQEVWARALKLFYIPKKHPEELISLIDIKERKKEIHELHYSGVPIIGIYGTHERRGQSLNPIGVLDEGGYVIQLHGETAILEKNKECVAIYGISGVPEIFAKDVIKELNPKPIEGLTNIFMLHQSIEGFIYSDEEKAILKVGDLPKGFDLIINGHIHWSQQAQVGNIKILLPGSTITTQVRKTECDTPKRVFFYDTKTKEISYKDLKTPRKVFYEEINCDNLGNLQIKLKIKEKLKSISGKFKKKPLITIKLTGRIKVKTQISFSDIIEQYKDRFILKINDKIKSDDQEKKIKLIHDLRESELSIDEIGLRILQNKAVDTKLGINYKQMFELLSENKIDEAEESISLKEAEKVKKELPVEEIKEEKVMEKEKLKSVNGLWAYSK